MKFDILNRWTRAVQVTAEITCSENATYGVKLGLAVRWAHEHRADLTRADLTDADLTRADLTDADLTRAVLTDAVLTRAVLTDAVLTDADLTRAVLTRAVLTDADLRTFKADLWMTLTQNAAEVPALIAALKAGKVNGSTYSGDCACLVGTIANARGVDYDDIEHSANNPAERWFLMIKKGDKPGDSTGGGFAAQKALEWAEEWQVLVAGRQLPPGTGDDVEVGIASRTLEAQP